MLMESNRHQWLLQLLKHKQDIFLKQASSRQIICCSTDNWPSSSGATDDDSILLAWFKFAFHTDLVYLLLSGHLVVSLKVLNLQFLYFTSLIIYIYIYVSVSCGEYFHQGLGAMTILQSGSLPNVGYVCVYNVGLLFIYLETELILIA